MAPQLHAARRRIVISRSPGTAESRTSSAECLAKDPALRTSPNPTVSVSVQDTMARIKRTARQCSSDGVFYHSDGSTVFSDGSIRVPRSELSEHPDSPSYLPPTPTYYHSPTSSGTPSDGILGEADEEYQPGPSGQAPEESLGEDPAGTSRRSPSSDESSDDESASSSSSENASVTSEEARSNIDSARESLAVDRGESWAEPSASRRLERAPYYQHVPPGRRSAMASGLANFRRKVVLGYGYTLSVPNEGDTITWPSLASYQDRAFGCYEAAFQAGLRFPLHPAVERILDGYQLGIWQLVPNSWINILGYVAACEMLQVEASFEAFAHMHYLSRAPARGGEGWYTLTTCKGYMMAVGKENKWKDWRTKFYIVKSADSRLNQKYNRWNKDPPLLAGRSALPPIPRRAKEEIMDAGLFTVSVWTNDEGDKEVTPQCYLPLYKWFEEGTFLAACGLSSEMPRGSRPSVLYAIYFCFSVLV